MVGKNVAVECVSQGKMYSTTAGATKKLKSPLHGVHFGACLVMERHDCSHHLGHSLVVFVPRSLPLVSHLGGMMRCYMGYIG